MAPRRSSISAVLVLALGLCGAVHLLSMGSSAFVTSPHAVPRDMPLQKQAAGQEKRVPVDALALGATAGLATAQPAFADADNLPGWPYVLVFVTLFIALFIIPNTFWR